MRGLPFHCNACRAVPWKTTNESTEFETIMASAFLSFFCFVFLPPLHEHVKGFLSNCTVLKVNLLQDHQSNVLFLAALLPGNFTACGNEGVNISSNSQKGSVCCVRVGWGGGGGGGNSGYNSVNSHYACNGVAERARRRTAHHSHAHLHPSSSPPPFPTFPSALPPPRLPPQPPSLPAAPRPQEGGVGREGRKTQPRRSHS